MVGFRLPTCMGESVIHGVDPPPVSPLSISIPTPCGAHIALIRHHHAHRKSGRVHGRRRGVLWLPRRTGSGSGMRGCARPGHMRGCWRHLDRRVQGRQRARAVRRAQPGRVRAGARRVGVGLRGVPRVPELRAGALANIPGAQSSTRPSCVAVVVCIRGHASLYTQTFIDPPRGALETARLRAHTHDLAQMEGGYRQYRHQMLR